MHRLIACLLVVLVADAARAQETVGQGVPLTVELVDAYREYAIARQQLIRYRQVVVAHEAAGRGRCDRADWSGDCSAQSPVARLRTGAATWRILTRADGGRE